jgi:hypothetical protein
MIPSEVKEKINAEKAKMAEAAKRLSGLQKEVAAEKSKMSVIAKNLSDLQKKQRQNERTAYRKIIESSVLRQIEGPRK